MYEYKILKIYETSSEEEQNHWDSFGKVEFPIKFPKVDFAQGRIETDEFIKVVETTINQYANQGWKLIFINHEESLYYLERSK
ncbi:MAG: hypothetical protein ABII85_03775 [Bacillota bacterium]